MTDTPIATLQPLDLQRLLRSEAEAKLAILQVENAQWRHRVAMLEAVTEQTRQLAHLNQAKDEAAIRHRSVVLEMESRYSVSLRDNSYDTESGDIFPLKEQDDGAA